MQPTPFLNRHTTAVAIFTGLYLLGFGLGALIGQNLEFLFYCAVLAIIIPLVALVHWRIRLHPLLLWALSLWGLAHMAGGLLQVPEGWAVDNESRVLYTLWIFPHWLKYDHVVHVYGFGVTTWVCWQALRATACPEEPVRFQPTFGRLVLCIAAGMGFGALNEVIEFFAVLVLPETNVGGYYNTGWDLVANLFGCSFAAWLIWLAGHFSGRIGSER